MAQGPRGPGRKVAMILEEARKAVVAYGKKLVLSGLTRGTGGNLSVYDRKRDLWAVSPSGIDYFAVEAEDVAVLDGQGRLVQGRQRPSSEWELHLEVYRRRPDAGAVVHTHSPFATVLACLGWEIPPVHYLVGYAGRKVKVAPYATFGTPELARLTAEALGDDGAVLMAHHGLIAQGADIDRAFAVAEEIEFVAEIYWRAKAVGTVPLLSEEAMADALARFVDYGPRRKA